MSCINLWIWIWANFNTILKNFNPKHLEVAGRFQRRGGIDINPVRGTHKKFLFKNFREFNQ